MSPASLAERVLRLRSRPLPRPGRRTLWAAGACAWTAVFLRQGKALERQGRRLSAAQADEKPAGWGGVLKRAYSRWSADQVTRLAAALSYYTVFSVAPLVLLMISVVGLFFGQEAAQAIVSDSVVDSLGADKARALQEMLAGAQRPKTGRAAGMIGFATLLLGASAVVGELQASLNQIYGVQPVAKSFWAALRRRLISLAFVLGTGFLLVASLAATTAVSAAGKFLGGALHLPEAVLHALNQAASFGVISALFASMFRFLPDARLAWRDLWAGAAFTAVLFTLGDLALGLYLGKGGPASAYGAAGSLLAFLVWTYYSAQIVYFGAEFTRARAEARGAGVRPTTAGRPRR